MGVGSRKAQSALALCWLLVGLVGLGEGKAAGSLKELKDKLQVAVEKADWAFHRQIRRQGQEGSAAQSDGDIERCRDGQKDRGEDSGESEVAECQDSPDVAVSVLHGAEALMLEIDQLLRADAVEGGTAVPQEQLRNRAQLMERGRGLLEQVEELWLEEEKLPEPPELVVPQTTTPPPPPSGPKIQWGWEHLCPEVEALRRAPPDFLGHMGFLYIARQSARLGRLNAHEYGGRSFSSPSDLYNCTFGGVSGPWRLKVDIAAPVDAPPVFRRKHHRVVLVFTREWPEELPSIRFAGEIGSPYALPLARPSNQRSDTLEPRGAEASGTLRRHLEEAIGKPVTCMWRHSSFCRSDGSMREAEKDQLCNWEILPQDAGFCDCDGDGRKGQAEPGLACQQRGQRRPLNCFEACGQAGLRVPRVNGFRHTLRGILEAVSRSLAGPLVTDHQQIWQTRMAEFVQKSSMSVQYEEYGRRHPQLFGRLEEELLDATLLNALRAAFEGGHTRQHSRSLLLSSGVVVELVPNMVYTFPAFSEKLCTMLMEEFRHFENSSLPRTRPSNTNNYGALLREVGLEAFTFSVQDLVIQPLAMLLLPEAGAELEAHHAFTVRFRQGEDNHLDAHTDDSDVSFSVNLEAKHAGSEVVFCGIEGSVDHRHFKALVQHRLGHAVLHLGRQRHTVEALQYGERTNLVIWSYSHNYRVSHAAVRRRERENGPPHSRCLSYMQDRDFAQFRPYPEGQRSRYLGRGTVPMPGQEYDGFQSDKLDTPTLNKPRASSKG